MSDPETVQQVKAVIAEMRAEAAECMRYAIVPCQVEYAWHAERYLAWADQLDILIGSAPQWQPMDTAPKDGTRVLVRRSNKNHASAVVWWREELGDWYTNDLQRFYDPRWWMPVPPMPAEPTE